MTALERVVDLGSKLPGMREWRHRFPIVLAVFCSGLSGLMALAVGAATCVEVSVSALMACVGMVVFSSVLMFPRDRRRFYALADQLKPAAEAAAALQAKGARREADSADWHPMILKLWAIEAELRVAGFLVPPVRSQVTAEVKVMHMAWREFAVWGQLLSELHVYARERRHADAVEACRRASERFEAVTGEPANVD